MTLNASDSGSGLVRLHAGLKTQCKNVSDTLMLPLADLWGDGTGPDDV